jgi:transcriptional regulator with XRE-family HTH domain
MILLRRELGDVLRSVRREQGRTLREVAQAAQLSLGYLSEIERGEKEASSELLAAVCDALGVRMSDALLSVSQRLAAAEDVAAPVQLPVPSASSVVSSAA